MRVLVVCALFLGAALAESNLDDAWNAWKAKFNKAYETEVEDSVRKAIWLNHAKEVSEHNLEYSLGLHTYTQGMTLWTDMTNDEYRSMLGNKIQLTTAPATEDVVELLPGTPATQDWTSAGYVTAVKDQGQCGSCWAFSTTGSTESMCAIQQGKSTLLSLSEQDLVSCNTRNGGCNGGNFFTAFKYFESPGAISEANYPYTSGNGVTGSCQSSGKPISKKVSGSVATTPGSENALQNAVGNTGPCSVAIDASQNSFSRYTSGIYSSSTCSSTNLDHAVLTTGYNSDSSGKYWIVKNSWGTSWGQKGYIWMARDDNNMCGIATQPGYPKGCSN